MTELHWETVTPLMRDVLRAVGQSELCSRFYLAGGSGLALQLGHRRSIDLDFFSETDEVRPAMHRQALRVLDIFRPTIVEQAWGNLLLVIQDLHVGFFGYGYPLVVPPSPAEGVPLASVADVGLMKLDALATRASRKDFYDLYTIAQHIALRELLDLAPTKYPGIRDFESLVIRYMVYFDRAEQEQAPLLLEAVDWSAVKAFFRAQAMALGRTWLE